MPGNPVRPSLGRFPEPTYDEWNNAMMRMNDPQPCPKCRGGGRKVVGWRPNPKDKVGGAYPPIVEYGPCECKAAQ